MTTVAKAKKSGAGASDSGPGNLPVHEIRRFYELGRRVIARAAEDRSDVAAATRAVAADEGVGFDRARKAAYFAHRFEKRSIGPLCNFHLPDGSPLSVNHIRRMLKIENAREWRSWLQRTAAAGWSADRLDREIKQSLGTDAGIGGPKIKGPADLLEALGQVSGCSDAWLKRYDGIWSQDAAWPPRTGLGGADPAMLLGRIRGFRGALEALRKGAEAPEKRLETIEKAVRGKGRTKGENGRKGIGAR